MSLHKFLQMVGLVPQTPLGNEVQRLMDEARAEVSANWRKVHERERVLRAMENRPKKRMPVLRGGL